MKTLKLLLPMLLTFGSAAHAAPSIELNNPTFEHYSDAWNQEYGVVFIGGEDAQKIVTAMQVPAEKIQSVECPFGNQGGECIEAPAYYTKKVAGLYCSFPAEEPVIGSATCSFVMFFTEVPGAFLPGKVGVRDAVAGEHTDFSLNVTGAAARGIFDSIQTSSTDARAIPGLACESNASCALHVDAKRGVNL